MLTSTRRGIVYPNPTRTDSADVPRDILALVTALEIDVIYGQGTLASRPTSSGGSPGIQGRIYYATDTVLHYWDAGTSWVTIGSPPSMTSISTSILLFGTLAARPAAAGGNANFLYFTTDTKVLYQNQANVWVAISSISQYTASIGDGVSTSLVVNHNLGSQNVLTQVRQTASPFALVEPEVQITDANNVTMIFDVAPSAGQYTVTVLGGATGTPSAPSAHASTHVAGGADALPWGTIHNSGTLASRPAASSSNSGYRYFATDAAGGTEYQSTGAAWFVVAQTITARHSARVRQSAVQSIPPGMAYTVLNFDTEDWDTDTLHDTVTNNSRITIPAALAGLWRLTAVLAMANPAEAGAPGVGIHIRKNGATVLAGIVSPSHNDITNCSVEDVAASTDYYEVLAAQAHTPTSSAVNTGTPTYFIATLVSA